MITIESLILCQSFNYMMVLMLVYTLPAYFSISFFFNANVESGNPAYGCIPRIFRNAELWIAAIICIALCIFPQVVVGLFAFFIFCVFGAVTVFRSYVFSIL